MPDEIHKQVGHMIRWALELMLVWAFVFPETGGWTCFALTMITVGIEFDHFNAEDWK